MENEEKANIIAKQGGHTARKNSLKNHIDKLLIPMLLEKKNMEKFDYKNLDYLYHKTGLFYLKDINNKIFTFSTLLNKALSKLLRLLPRFCIK